MIQKAFKAICIRESPFLMFFIPKLMIHNVCTKLKIVGISLIHKLGSVGGPVIQANGRLTFEDDLRSGGLLYFNTQ